MLVVPEEPVGPLAGRRAGVAGVDQLVCDRPEVPEQCSRLGLEAVLVHECAFLAAPVRDGLRHEPHAGGELIKGLLDVGQRDREARHCVRAACPLL